MSEKMTIKVTHVFSHALTNGDSHRLRMPNILKLFRSSFRTSNYFLQVPLHLRLPHPPSPDYGRQPPAQTDLRPLHQQGRAGEALKRPQGQVPILPGGTESRGRLQPIGRG